MESGPKSKAPGGNYTIEISLDTLSPRALLCKKVKFVSHFVNEYTDLLLKNNNLGKMRHLQENDSRQMSQRNGKHILTTGLYSMDN